MKILLCPRYFEWKSLENVWNLILTSWFVWSPGIFCRFSCSTLLVDKLWADPFLSLNHEPEKHLDVQKYNCVICSLFFFCFSVALLVSINATFICLVLLSWNVIDRFDLYATRDCFLPLDSFFDEPAMLTDMFTAWSDSAFVLVVMSTGMSCDHLAVHMFFTSWFRFEYYDHFS